MASSSRVFGRTCRTLMAAAKSPAGTPTAAAATPTATTAAATDAATTTITTAVSPATEAIKMFLERRKTKSVGILTPLPISPALGEFLGTSEASRTDAVKKIWEYIKLNNLQNPANKKEVFCDAKLKTIFDGKDQVGFLEIAKLLSQHFVKT